MVELYHHGTLGQKWGHRNGPPYPLNQNSKGYSLNRAMSDFTYSDFTTLKSPEQVKRDKSGSCHDQVMYELSELKKAGLNPKAKFLIEVDGSGQGYQTHSFAYYKEENKIQWFENAWKDQRGIHSYNSVTEMKKDVEKRLQLPKDRKVLWGNFVESEHRVGEDLQTLVDTCLSSKTQPSKQPTSEINDKINSIYKSLSSKEKQYLGGNPISEHTVYANTKKGAYIVLDDYGDKYKDEHPYRGKIVSIAASKESRGTGVTDMLIKEAIKDNPKSKLIAEIDTSNNHSKQLFERNGFKLIDEFDDISFYKYDKKIEHGESMMNGNSYLAHHGILGQKWGVQNGPPYPIGITHGEYKSSDVVFISGKVKFDEKLPVAMRDELDLVMKTGCKILIGDAPGADTRCQEYLAENKYDNVEVYTTDDIVRNNVGNWTVKKISSDGYEDEREARRQKDIAMTNASTKGIAISSSDDRLDSATSLNIQRLTENGKDVQFYDYKKNELYKKNVKQRNKSMNTTYLAHHGILGQKWGVRRYQNADGSLTAAGEKHVAKLRAKMEKKDSQWAEKNQDKITSNAYHKSEKELKRYLKSDLDKNYQATLKSGKMGKRYMNQYNRKLAELMNKNVGEVKAPSGRLVKFVAKRGSLGVYMALADEGYDMSNVKNGVYNGGRIAYKKSSIEFKR